jgi:hypothetical protein
MEAVGLDSNGNFSFRGICPYPACNRASIFLKINASSAGIRNERPGQAISRIVAILQCQGCQKYILGLVEHTQGYVAYQYLEHYPIGSPDETVAEDVPDHIKDDFKEALRCLWVNAYNATAEMCRRAMEASCLDLGAPHDKVLEKMIDWLEAQRKITPYLKDAAHKVRLGGNRGAHPPATPVTHTTTPATSAIPPTVPMPTIATVPASPIEKIEKEHAEAIVEFTREFFHHVYVGPKLVGKYDFSKPKTTILPTK